MKKRAFIDFAGTIAQLIPTDEQIIREFLSQQKLEQPSTFTLQKTLYSLAEKLPFSSVELTSEKLRKTHYVNKNAQILRALGAEAHGEELYMWFKTFARDWTLYQDVRPSLRLLRREGIPVSILSNFDENLPEVVKKLGLAQLVDDIFVSSLEGVEKPAIDFYKVAGIKTGVKSQPDIHYAGDSWSLDIAPAQILGVSASLICRYSCHHKVLRNSGSHFTGEDAVYNWSESVVQKPTA